MDSTPGRERQRSRISRGDPSLLLAGDNGIKEYLASIMGSLVKRRGPKSTLLGREARRGLQLRPKEELKSTGVFHGETHIGHPNGLQLLKRRARGGHGGPT